MNSAVSTGAAATSRRGSGHEGCYPDRHRLPVLWGLADLASRRVAALSRSVFDRHHIVSEADRREASQRLAAYLGDGLKVGSPGWSRTSDFLINSWTRGDPQRFMQRDRPVTSAVRSADRCA